MDTIKNYLKDRNWTILIGGVLSLLGGGLSGAVSWDAVLTGILGLLVSTKKR